MKIEKKNIFSSLIFGLFLLLISFLFFGCEKDDKSRINILKAVKQEVLANMPLEVKEDVNSFIPLIVEKNGVSITYISSNDNVISQTGIINYPIVDTFVDMEIIFSINLGKNLYTEKVNTTILVRRGMTDEEKFNNIKNVIEASINKNVKEDLDFLTSSLYNSTIRYESSDNEILSNDGKLLKEVYNKNITLSCFITLNGIEKEPFEIELVVSNLKIDETIEQKLNDIEMDVFTSFGNTKINSDITLQMTSMYDSVIRYESSDEEALSIEGVVGANIEKEVTLSFYIILNEIEYGPYNINIIIDTKEKTNDNEYYNSIDSSLRGSRLKQALRTLTKTTQTYITTYDDIKTITAKTDADPDKPGNIILFYSRVSVSAKWDGGKTWNREHVWPRSKSWFQYDGAGSDIHHLRPTNPSINSSRGNKAYYTSTTTDYYGPTDEVKGDIARIVFYLLVRYSESDSYPITNVAYSMNMLLEWNKLDPVDDLEIVRNEECFKFQGNRNPFIDYPDYADMIWSPEYLDYKNIKGNYVVVNIVLIKDIKKKDWV